MRLACPSRGTKNRVPGQRPGQDPLCGRRGGALMAPRPVALDDERLLAFIEGAELPVLVDYRAEWCGPYRMMAPQFEAAAAQMPQVRFAKVDTEASPEASAPHRIHSIPSLALLHRGQEVARRSGAMPTQDIVKWLRRQLGA